jgi:adenylate cyclase
VVLYVKYQSKLLVSFVVVSVLSSAIGLSIVYVDSKEQLTQYMRERISDVAATAAALIDPSVVERVIAQGSEDTEEYKHLVQLLRKARDANISKSWHVVSLYIMTVSPADKNQMIFVADAEENPDYRVHFGDKDLQQDYSHILENLYTQYSPDNFVTDAWGTWLSGFCPMFNSSGGYIATIGADVSESIVEHRLLTMLKFGLFGLVGSVMLSLICAYFFSKRSSRSLAIIGESMKEISQGNISKHIDLESGDEFALVATGINSMLSDLQEREKMKTSFARYVSKHVLETIIKTGSSKKLAGERRKITILFTDIRQFTNLSEKMPPEHVVSILNEYFENMIDTIFKYQGTLDKFLGDGMMVEFGAPLEDSMQELHAVQAAIEMQQTLAALSARWRSAGKPELKMGVGIHTGYAVVGNIGSEKRLEYTAIGDTVNVASRLERATKGIDVNILISDATYLAVKDHFDCTEVGPLNLPGRSEGIRAFSVSITQPVKSN